MRYRIGVHSSIAIDCAVVGLRNHVLGLLGYAGQIEPAYANTQRKLFETIAWPM